MPPTEPLTSKADLAVSPAPLTADNVTVAAEPIEIVVYAAIASSTKLITPSFNTTPHELGLSPSPCLFNLILLVNVVPYYSPI